LQQDQFCSQPCQTKVRTKTNKQNFTFLTGNKSASVTEVSLGSDLKITTASSKKEIIRESINSVEDSQALKYETKKTGKHTKHI